MELGQATYDMIKAPDGSWEVTTPPLLPGFHYYAISADGFVSNDPGSRVFFAAKREVSGLEVPSLESSFAINPVPHGTVRTEWYRSSKTGENSSDFCLHAAWLRSLGFTFSSAISSDMASVKMKRDGATKGMRTLFSTT